MPGPNSIVYSKSMQAGGSRVARKAARRRLEDRQIARCYRLVNGRDHRRCRVCGALTSPRGGLERRTVHHHLIFRSGISVQGGRHSTENVISLCGLCDSKIHVERILWLEGDADARNARGELDGVQVSRFVAGAWKVEGVC